jgi:hypothetical protein
MEGITLVLYTAIDDIGVAGVGQVSPNTLVTDSHSSPFYPWHAGSLAGPGWPNPADPGNHVRVNVMLKIAGSEHVPITASDQEAQLVLTDTRRSSYMLRVNAWYALVDVAATQADA